MKKNLMFLCFLITLQISLAQTVQNNNLNDLQMSDFMSKVNKFINLIMFGKSQASIPNTTVTNTQTSPEIDRLKADITDLKTEKRNMESQKSQQIQQENSLQKIISSIPTAPTGLSGIDKMTGHYTQPLDLTNQTNRSNMLEQCSYALSQGFALTPECSQFKPQEYISNLSQSGLSSPQINDIIKKEESGTTSDPTKINPSQATKLGSIPTDGKIFRGWATSYNCPDGVPQWVVDKYKCAGAWGKPWELAGNNYCGTALASPIMRQFFGTHGKEIKYKKIEIIDEKTLKCVVAPIQDKIGSDKVTYHPGSNAVVDLSFCKMKELTDIKINKRFVMIRPVPDGEAGCRKLMSIEGDTNDNISFK
jgi:hypothetical protein